MKSIHEWRKMEKLKQLVLVTTHKNHKCSCKAFIIPSFRSKPHSKAGRLTLLKRPALCQWIQVPQSPLCWKAWLNKMWSVGNDRLAAAAAFRDIHVTLRPRKIKKRVIWKEDLLLSVKADPHCQDSYSRWMQYLWWPRLLSPLDVWGDCVSQLQQHPWSLWPEYWPRLEKDEGRGPGAAVTAIKSHTVMQDI